jgi:integron cassette protein
MKTKTAVSIKVFSPRWGHDDTWRFSFIDNGWAITFGTGTHQATLRCEDDVDDADTVHDDERFFHWASNDMVQVAESAPDFLRYLWNQYNDSEITEEELRTEFESFASWITSTTNSRPQTPVFKGYAG